MVMVKASEEALIKTTQQNELISSLKNCFRTISKRILENYPEDQRSQFIFEHDWVIRDVRTFEQLNNLMGSDFPIAFDPRLNNNLAQYLEVIVSIMKKNLETNSEIIERDDLCVFCEKLKSVFYKLRMSMHRSMISANTNEASLALERLISEDHVSTSIDSLLNINRNNSRNDLGSVHIDNKKILQKYFEIQGRGSRSGSFFDNKELKMASGEVHSADEITKILQRISAPLDKNDKLKVLIYYLLNGGTRQEAAKKVGYITKNLGEITRPETKQKLFIELIKELAQLD
jgi:hypothetical protein